MKTLITQPASLLSNKCRTLLPVLLAALFSLGAFSANSQTWIIGTGTGYYSQNNAVPAPLGYYNSTGRMQYLYKASEMTAAGMTAGNIHQIAFNVAALQSASPAPNYTVSIIPVAATTVTLPTSGFINGGTQVYNNPSGVGPGLGWNNLTFNVGSGVYPWNGTDNLVIDICYFANSTSVGTGNAGVTYTSMTGVSTYASGNSLSAYCGLPLTPSTLTYRPNIRFARLSSCGGVPQAGTLSPTGTVTVSCPGTRYTLTAPNIVSPSFSNPTGPANATNILDLTYQWMYSPTGTGTWTTVGTSASFTTPPLIATAYYHLVLTCQNSGSKNADSTNTVYSYTGGYPVYATLPYFESFENWGNGCATNDRIASNNWTNVPNTGDNSWRREDQGASANWTCPTCYATARPASVDGLHSARWHGYKPTSGPASEGALNLYVNTNNTLGNKDLEFNYRFNYPYYYPYDSLNVDMSTDGGATFAPLPGGQFGVGNSVLGAWNFVQIQNIPVVSLTTVFRFRAKQGSTYYDDIYIDAVRVLPPCTGRPTAGTINPVNVCSGQPFTLAVTGISRAAGLSYQWQYMTSGTTTWQPLPGGTVQSPTATITAPTQFRLIVTCNNSTPVVSDTSVVYSATLQPFYYCYCAATGVTTASYNYFEIGNTNLTSRPGNVVLINNGNPTPTIGNTAVTGLGYEDFRRTVPAPTLIQDSLYKLKLTMTTAQTYYQTGGYSGGWLDSNRNGTFEPGERVLFRPIGPQANPTSTDSFRIGARQQLGLTGLRVVMEYYYSGYGVNPCGSTYLDGYGQYEDYLVNIDYQPCNGPVNPGTAFISDTSVCRGYTVDMWDTTYEHQRTGITRVWEVSTNGGASYSAIPGTAQKDSIFNIVVTGASKYRLRVICGRTGDTTFSNILNVSEPIPVRCYPVAWASLGAADSSDIGAVILGSFTNPVAGAPAGPHLGNPLAKKRRTDYTLLPPIELNADSTYRLAIFHTMPRDIHADALVSVYIDYNNNAVYDRTVSGPPFTSELVYQGVTRYNYFFLDTMVKMPHDVIPNVPTGMRVVLNNDLNPLGAGNIGSGTFGSGEVEDYVVIFRRVALGTGNTTLLQNLSLYPNPTEGKFTVISDAARAVAHMDVVVSTITGQQVLSRSFENVGTHFNTSLDLSNQAKGIYFVEIRADGEKVTKKLTVR